MTERSSSTRNDELRSQVRAHYAERARANDSCCSCTPSCCGAEAENRVLEKIERLGYSAHELAEAPDAAVMSLGCGNPKAIAALRPGEIVVDLGSGGGLDCFLAARAVGPQGRVIGVDMTPEMVSLARSHAERLGYDQVEFRLGEIEHLPIADGTADVVISNCVINLSPDKRAVFTEAYRVLKPGGRLAIADVVATAPLPEGVRADMALWAGCVGGAAHVAELEEMLSDVGFERVRITPKEDSREMIAEWVPGSRVEDYVVSATIEAIKPGAA